MTSPAGHGKRGLPSDRPDHPHPHRLPVEIPGLEAPVRLLGREDRRVLAVLVDEELGRAVDVDLTWHQRRVRLPPASVPDPDGPALE